LCDYYYSYIVVVNFDISISVDSLMWWVPKLPSNNETWRTDIHLCNKKYDYVLSGVFQHVVVDL